MMRGFAFSVLAFLVVLTGVYAQVGDPSKKQVSIVAEGKDIREALRTLFKQVGNSYSIAPEVQGTVNLKMENVPFERALRSVLAQVDSTFRVEADIYHVILLEQSLPRTLRFGGGPVPDDSTVIRQSDIQPAQTPPVISQDDKFLYILKGEIIYKVEKGSLKTVSRRRLGQ